MTRSRTALAGAAALGAAVLVFVGAVLPPTARQLSPAGWQPAGPSVGGVFHVHTVRSDGTGTVDEVAAAAARAGLRFVIFTDHGDGTRAPDPPAYRSGVLCLDGVEISTDGGHYAAVGSAPAPYPLGGDPRDTVEDVRRLGGIGIVTHPDSAKPALRWGGGDLPFDGMEWLNADSEWRDETRARLAVALLTYPLRPAETVASLFRRPTTLSKLDDLRTRHRTLLAVAGADAHARVGWQNQGDPYEERTLLSIPSYESTFRAFSLRVLLEQAPSGRARDDADALLTAIRAGHVHTVVDAWARPTAFEFTGQLGAERMREGDVGELTDVLVLRARSNGPAGTRLVLFRDGHEVQRLTARELTYATNREGSYRVEAWLPDAAPAPMPWIVSNAISVARVRPGPVSSPSAPGAPDAPVVATIDPRQGWSVEHEESSAGATTTGAEATRLEYRLGAAPRGSQFVALSHPIGLPAAASAIAFTASAAAPMRVSVQLRVPKGHDGERWVRSVYLDAAPRELRVPLADMRPAGAVSSQLPAVERVDSLLFVVDRVHAKAGSAGEFSVSNVRVLGR
jgi:hypothetical protein